MLDKVKKRYISIYIPFKLSLFPPSSSSIPSLSHSEFREKHKDQDTIIVLSKLQNQPPHLHLQRLNASDLQLISTPPLQPTLQDQPPFFSNHYYTTHNNADPRSPRPRRLQPQLSSSSGPRRLQPRHQNLWDQSPYQSFEFGCKVCPLCR